MRTKNMFVDSKDEGEVIVTCGGAMLMKQLDGRLVLKAGSK